MTIDYSPNRGECLHAVHYNSQPQHTIWHLIPDREIYTMDEDSEKRYLWSILDGVYVTPDEYLAERWITTPVEHFKPDVETRDDQTPQIVGIVILATILIFMLYQR